MLLLAKGASRPVLEISLSHSFSKTFMLLLSFAFFGFNSNHIQANNTIFSDGSLEDVAVCEGEEFTLTAISPNPDPISYNWEIDLGSGFVSTGQTDQTFTQAEAPCEFNGALLRVTIGHADPADDIVCDPVTIYVNCESTIACYSRINVAVNGDCEAVLTPQAFVSNYLSDDFYTVTFTDEAGVVYTGNNLGIFIGQTITYEISDICGNACWGEITVEDKSGAMFENCGDYVMTCEEFEAGNSAMIHVPNLNGNCTMEDDVTFTFEDDTLSVMCLNGYANAIERTWLAFDEEDNFFGKCVQRINIQALGIADIVFPEDINIDYDQNTSCDVFTDEFLHPDNLGYPTAATCPNFVSFWEDTEFILCGASRKIYRRWTVVDWCTGDIAEGAQIIKVEDDEPAIKTCPEDVMFPTKHGCTADINLDPWNLVHGMGALQLLIDCSDVTLTVEYLRAEPGTDQPLSDGAYSSDGVVFESDSTFTLPTIAEEFVWIRYRILDACENMPILDSPEATDDATSCYFEVQLVDGAPPTAICEGYTTITLDEYGYATLKAETIDDHSIDHCGDILDYKIKRQGFCVGHETDVDFSDEIHFCCADVGNTLWVFLAVYDEDGNSSICEGQVNVIPGSGGGTGIPDIVCPADITLDCNQDYNYYSYPDITIGNHHDGCGSTTASYYTDDSFDTSNLNGCGLGFIIRTVKVTFENGTIKTCAHKIFVEAGNPLNPNDIYVESMITVNTCNQYDGDALDPEIIGGTPTITGTYSTCISITKEYEDEIIAGGIGSCQQVKRTWTVTDFCVDNGMGSGVYEFEQIIKLNDNIKPAIACDDVWLFIDNADCNNEVSHTIMVTDNCTPDALINLSWNIDVLNDGLASNDLSGNSLSFTATIPLGTHPITVTAVDACNNSRNCTYNLVVEAGQGGGTGGTNASCLTELQWTLGPNGVAEIWASDFNFNSSAGCDGSDYNLTYSFTSPDFNSTPVIYYDCNSLNGNSILVLPVTIWVSDAAGYYSTCTSILHLRDVLNVCGNNVNGGTYNVNGRLTTENGNPVPEFEVSLEDMTMDEMSYNMSDEEGNYVFTSLTENNDYMIKPTHDLHHGQGVTTLDLVLIQKHILGLEELDSPYKLIAADVNNSESISASDLIQIRKLILGVYDKFPNQKSWVFVDNDFVFSDLQHPWDYSDEAYIQNLQSEDNKHDFTAVKIGDVNNSITMEAHNNTTSSRSGGLNLRIDALDVVEGAIYKIPVYSEDFQDIYGLQFALETKNLRILDVEGGLIPIKEHNYALEQERITFSWNDSHALGFNDQALFEIKVLATEDGRLTEGLFLDQLNFQNEVYVGKNIEVKPLQLQVGNQGSFENVLGQNKPNPFSDDTEITISLSKAQSADLIFYDISGMEIHRIDGTYPKGKSVIEVSADWLNTNGVIYYKLEGENFTAIKKMVLVK